MAEFNPYMPWLLAGLSFLLCLVSTPIVKSVAVKRGWIANPTKERWHQKPTALMGGVAIYTAISIPLLFLCDFNTLIDYILKTTDTSQPPTFSTSLWVGMTLAFILGLLDDLINIKPHTKLLGQIIIASLMAFWGLRINWFESMTLDTVVTIFWIVGITNAFNLIDNMDGLCAGVGAIAAMCLALLFFQPLPLAGIAAMIIAGSLLAFLIYNFNPASIFMGDSGSLVIGLSLSMLCLQVHELKNSNMLFNYVIPVLVLLVPIFDTTLVSMVRVLSGRKASTGGRDHTSHRLVLMGFTEKSSVLFLYGVGAIAAVAAIVSATSDTLTTPAVIVPTVLAILLMGIYLSQLRVYPEKEFSVLRGKSYTPILVDLTYKRQILLVLLDFFLISFSYYLAYRLRFSGDEFNFFFKTFLKSLPAVIACKFVAFFWIGIYRSIWDYLSVNDIYVYLKASVLGSLISVFVVTFVFRFESFSKSVFLIDWLLITFLLFGTRGSFRFFWETVKRKRLSGTKILIYGAGRGGEILLREILNNQMLEVKPVGFIDDDPLKVGKRLNGYPILGTGADIQKICKQYEVQELLMSFRNGELKNVDSLKAFCKKERIGLKRFSIAFLDIDLN